MSEAAHEARSLPRLLSDLVRELVTLVQRESRLVRTELSEKISQVESGLGYMVAGAICILVALQVLVGALVIALAQWIGAGWSALAVGAVLAIIGALLARKGTAEMHDLAPTRSMQQIGEDARLAREQAR
jgi:predicted phage tail protein